MPIQQRSKCFHSPISVLYIFVVVFLAGITHIVHAQESSARPNIVILFVDDLGYGDLQSYGHPSIRTPNIGQIAEDGVRFTSFYTGAWCVPSRTQLMTGRYMPRVSFGGSTGADGNGGLPESEVTLAEALKDAGYDTAMAGKWHLGYKKDKYLPPNQGFESWYGLPYSNDYRKPWVQTEEPLAKFRGTEIVEHPIDQDQLTTGYTREAIDFINDHQGTDAPFFFYLAYNMPHLPIHTAERFRGMSEAGLYGDVVETLDWSVGQVLDVLERHGIRDNTIVLFASDNGPWLNLPDRMLQAGNKPWHQGNTGLLRGSKATTYEGGTRVPAMISWPGVIESGRVTDEIIGMPDIYRTFVNVGRADEPNHELDGYNLMPFLKGNEDESPREEYAYFLRGELQAFRKGPWKLRLTGNNPQLFHLQKDPGERFNRADDDPERVKNMRKTMKKRAQQMGVGLPD